ncbi:MULTISPECIES: MetQ/NlpA family ABC transporter substrate-binding protein [unclassified Undibacterium]|uniref:MetQ/NlpA family ABC transporter substrate-binding protein n=1 Tax=unclassified Undibacterium TaxID=2630295 RepID=UPI002AC95DFA|nr:MULTISPECIES: MetQ/NlpA family ABC transporter substrate-binding protein [unclassified Undibacterium]MEB0137726.1 MetQ/NlpA family ABC transporter substrate-binding protein [Undibacterium sp. CCC2.1]MEB0172832.1 MetQ/NlpA family ABC transporter substrate-binding protein [Undibacterium sp. CCC1.1]MEB0176694.1 MetQ/NlpA family ABC transporter substrate-binding protein [Undibacterium sp. CCC3.4]MEB0215980.1 MetQ/NlpA family ABC transporter substrate-binding protein [Undibacterium sp. 5I2]WPX42
MTCSLQTRFTHLVAAGALALIATSAAAIDTLTIAATPVPHAEILEFIKPQLAKQGVDLKIKVFTDYIQPAVQVNEKHLDGNFFLHQPYLNEFKKSHPDDLEVVIAKVHVEPFAAYSSKYKTIAELPDGATVAIPNDPSNSGRALLLLAKNGLLKLKDPSNISATKKDIIDNPKHLKFKELEAATLPRILNQVDLALINTNYAIEAKLNPVKDSLLIEDANSPYANLLVAREDNKNSPAFKKLAAALNSPEVKKFIQEKYKGAVVPAF